MNWLFSASTPWAWDAEKNFKLLKEQTPNVARSASITSYTGYRAGDVEKTGMHIDNAAV